MFSTSSPATRTASGTKPARRWPSPSSRRSGASRGSSPLSVLALLGALAGIIYLISTAKLKRQLRAAQQKELIEHERARIARDLHDQLGANLTQVTLLGEMAEADKDLPGRNRAARAADLRDGARHDALAGRNRLGREPVQRHARRPRQLRLQIRAGLFCAGRRELPRRTAARNCRPRRFCRRCATMFFSRSRRP